MLAGIEAGILRGLVVVGAKEGEGDIRLMQMNSIGEKDAQDVSQYPYTGAYRNTE